MANHIIKSKKDYSEELRKLEISDPNHADIFNPLFEKLINNDSFLKEKQEETNSQISTHEKNTNIHTTKEEKEKLAGIEQGANKYIHPTTHPASMIVEDSTKRFVTDTEKNTWNNKLDKTTYTAQDVLNKIKTVDGTGSGLDADTLDGLHASDFQSYSKLYGNVRYSDNIQPNQTLVKSIPIGSSKKSGMAVIGSRILVFFGTDKTKTCAVGQSYQSGGAISRQFSSYVTSANKYNDSSAWGFGLGVVNGDLYSHLGIKDLYIENNQIKIEFYNIDTEKSGELSCSIAWEVW